MSIKSNSIAFCIVTYKELFTECCTYKSLIESFQNEKSNSIINIYIFDNSPVTYPKFSINNQLLSNDGIIINYFSKNENIGLSRAYNFLAEKAIDEGLEWIVLLDQDTTLPKNFYEIYTSTSPDIFFQAPKVLSNGILISPTLYSNYRSYIIKDINKCSFSISNISCINSGLLINLDLYKNVGGYNELLFLDFCDHEFILRVKLKYKKIKILDVFLNQDFSNDVHDFPQAFFRYKLFLNDLKSFRKGKNKFKLFFYVDLPRVLSLSKKFRTFKFIKYRFFDN